MDRWVTAEIAQTLTDAINQESWSYPFKARRVYVPQWTREEGNLIKVTVIPFEMGDQTLLNRLATASEGHVVSVCVQKGISNPDNNDEIDPLMKLVETIADWARELKRLSLPSGHTMAYQRAELAYSTDQMLSMSLFSGWTALTYKVIR